jgi:hypothetical protein
VEEHCVRFAEIVKGALDGQNYLRGIHEVPRTVRLCRGVGKLRSGEIGPLDHSRNSFWGFRS